MFNRREEFNQNYNNYNNKININGAHNNDRLKRKILNNDLNTIQNKEDYKDYNKNNYSYYDRCNSNNFIEDNKSRINLKRKNIFTSYQYKNKDNPNYNYNYNNYDNYNHNDNNEIYKNNFNKRSRPIIRPSKSAIPNKVNCPHPHRHKYQIDNYNNNRSESNTSPKDKNEFLLCQNCINERLIQLKKREKELSERDSIPAVFEDKYKNYNQNLINEKIKQREKNINKIYNDLEHWNIMNDKEKLIKENENSVNPLYKDNHNYLYEKFRTNYERKQKIINDNYNKFQNLERPEITNYYNNYVNNPKYKGIDYGEYRPKTYDIDNYRRDLDAQINYKNNVKRKEKEEDKIREDNKYKSDLENIEREKKEKELKKRKLKEELIKGNLELINAKQQKKEKQNEEELKYREYYDRQKIEYNNDLINEKKRKQRINREFYKENQKNLSKIKRKKEQQIIDDEKYRYNDSSFDPPKEITAECSNCHKIYPKKLLTSNVYFYKDNIKY